MSLACGVFLALLMLVIGVLIYRLTASKGGADFDDSSPMSPALRRILAAYLLLAGTFFVYLLVSLYWVDLPETVVLPLEAPPAPAIPAQNLPATAPAQNQNQPGGAQAQPQKMNGQDDEKAAPTIVRIFPETTLGSTPRISLAIYGDRFRETSKAHLNGNERPVTYVDSHLVRVALESADLVGAGSIIVDVKNSGSNPSNVIGVPIVKPTGILNVLGANFPVTKDVQLMLLVIFAGALGSYVHALQSLADFIGNRTLMTSWFWWYVTRPFLGAAMALIFYAVLRGGFLAGTPADAKVVNPFGVLAVGALVGMFSDKATQKLSEIFDTLFKSEDKRGGKLTTPVIDGLEPETVPVGAPPPVLTIRGDRLGRASIVRFNGEERKPDSVTEKEVRLKLKPEDVARAGSFKIAVVNGDGSTSTSATLHVSDLAMTTSTLSPAEVGKEYKQPITAAGGSATYKWSLVDAPTWLKIEEGTGELTGTPPTAGTSKLTVKVTDQVGACASSSFDLKVV
jgi:Putative Ig domain